MMQTAASTTFDAGWWDILFEHEGAGTSRAWQLDVQALICLHSSVMLLAWPLCGWELVSML